MSLTKKTCKDCKKSKPVDCFEEHRWVKIDKFVPEDMCNLLYHHIQLEALRLSHYDDENIPYDEAVDGSFTDTQAPGDFSKYGDPIMDTLLSLSLSQMQTLTGKQLTPTYSYHRLYTTGTDLKRHKDRPSCEISTTINLGGDPWPIFIDGTGSNNVIDEYKNIHKPDAPKGTKVLLEVGDMLVYSGCELEHWREPFEGTTCGQVFLHYNHLNGPFAEKNRFDRRPMLGVPPIRNT